SPDGSPGAHYYMLWMIGNRARALAPFLRAGVLGAAVRGLRQTVDETGPVGHLTASLPWAYSPYSFTVDAATPYPAESGLTFWHLGPKGLVRFAIDLHGHSTLVGTGAIDA